MEHLRSLLQNEHLVMSAFLPSHANARLFDPARLTTNQFVILTDVKLKQLSIKKSLTGNIGDFANSEIKRNNVVTVCHGFRMTTVEFRQRRSPLSLMSADGEIALDGAPFISCFKESGNDIVPATGDDDLNLALRDMGIGFLISHEDKPNCEIVYASTTGEFHVKPKRAVAPGIELSVNWKKMDEKCRCLSGSMVESLVSTHMSQRTVSQCGEQTFQRESSSSVTVTGSEISISRSSSFTASQSPTPSSSSSTTVSSTRVLPRDLQKEIEEFKKSLGTRGPNSAFHLNKEEDESKGGYRVVTAEPIPTNAVVLEYLGDEISKEEAVKREKQYSEAVPSPGCYIFECEGENVW